jgi:ferredoxin
LVEATVMSSSSSSSKVITESTTGRVLEFEAPAGVPLIDLCDDHAAPIPFSCRSASCGTCRVHVLEGGQHLVAPEQDELDLLDVFNHDPTRVRLTCQARLRPGAGVLRLKAFHDE